MMLVTHSCGCEVHQRWINDGGGHDGTTAINCHIIGLISHVGTFVVGVSQNSAADRGGIKQV